MNNLIFISTLLENSWPTSTSIPNEEVQGIINFTLQLKDANYEPNEVIIRPYTSIDW